MTRPHLDLPNITDEGSKKLEIQLGATNWLIPETDIFDEPTRCYKINLEWSPIVMGLVSLLTEVSAWKDAQDETYPPIIAIRRFLRGADCMDCEDVADCVESELATNQDLINAIYASINNGGFGDPNHVNPNQTTVKDRNAAGALQEEVKELENCNLDVLWGGIRNGIVLRLDDNARDMLEDLNTIADTAERLVVFIDIIPVMGDLVEALATQIVEIVPDLLTLFNAHSSLSALDEIACHIFDIVCSECRYPTFEEIFNYYLSEALPGMVGLETLTLEQMSEYILELITNPSSIAYHTIIVWQLYVLNLQATFNGESGTKAIVKMAELGEDASANNWQSLCGGCDESYAYWILDFTKSKYETYKTTGGFSSFGGSYWQGKGWRLDKITSTGARLTVSVPFDPTWKLRAFGWKTNQARSVYGASIAPQARPIVGSNTSQTTFSMGAGYSNQYDCKDGLLSITNYSEFALSLIIDPVGSTIAYLEKMIFIFDKGFAPQEAIPTPDNTACDWQY